MISNVVKQQSDIRLKRHRSTTRRVGIRRTEASPQGKRTTAGRLAGPEKGGRLVSDHLQRTIDEDCAIYQFMQAKRTTNIFAKVITDLTTQEDETSLN